MLRQLLLSTALVAAAGAAAAAQGWTPSGSRDGVQLYFRDDPALDAREMRAVGELPHPASRITAVACDFTQRLDPDVRESKVLSGDLQGSYVIYLRYAPRFMVVAARDVVIAVDRKHNGCSWSERNTLVREHAGTVRMPLLRGSWTVEESGVTRARVVYQVTVKPGGRIPGWLVRRGASAALPDSIARLTRCLDRSPAAGVRC